MSSEQDYTLENQHQKLKVLTSIDPNSALLKFEISNSRIGSQTFSFDFRYYENYNRTNDSDHNSGLYTFKTSFNESRPFKHSIKSIKAYQGKVV